MTQPETLPLACPRDALERIDFDDPKVIAAIHNGVEGFEERCETKYRDRLEQFETKFEGDGGVIWP